MVLLEYINTSAEKSLGVKKTGKYMKCQVEEHDKQHFPLSSGERLKVYKLVLSPCIVLS